MSDENDDLKWYHLSVCRGMKTNWFFDDYENDPVFSSIMDSICSACPVRAMCLREGIENQEYGLWGGVFLSNGKTDVSKNAHKTEEDWKEVERIIKWITA